MLNLKLSNVVLLMLAFSQAGYCAETPTPSATESMSNQFWWPERLDLAPLRQHSLESNPMDRKFDYAMEFKKLDIKAVKKDIDVLM